MPIESTVKDAAQRSLPSDFIGTLSQVQKLRVASRAEVIYYKKHRPKAKKIAGDLNAVADYVSRVPGANGKVAVGGFCWGGTTTFFFATRRSTLKAAFVFYGTAPANNAQGQPYAIDKDALAKIGAPVYGFYGENDMRVDATVPPTTDAMKELKKPYDPVTYAGAGHGFMRAGEPNNPPPAAAPAGSDEATMKKAADAMTSYQANRKARDDAWVRLKAILAKL